MKVSDSFVDQIRQENYFQFVPLAKPEKDILFCCCGKYNNDNDNDDGDADEEEA